MKQDLSHILITGASSGIGEALALHYAAPGITLSINGRNEQRLSAVAKACRAQGAEVHDRTVDVTDEGGMKVWMLERDSAQPIDLVIANAGISAGTGGPKGETDAQVRQLFDVNVTGAFNTVHPLLPEMKARKQGQIAIMSSLAGFRGYPSAPAYCASKAAVRVYGESLRGDLAPYNVQVNVICPGFVRSRITDMNDFPMPFLMEGESAARLIARDLQRNKGRIVFPWPLAFLSWLGGIMPNSIMDCLSKKLPAKKAI